VTIAALIWTHGGPKRQMYSAFHFLDDYAQSYAMNQYFASKGFVVLSINYRSGIGYGRSFRKCPGCEALGAAEYLDILGGNYWLASQPLVDASRIGIFGLSYGGLNTLQALARNSDVFAAGVAHSPVFNWISVYRFVGAPWFDYMPNLHTALPVGPEPNLAGPDWTDKVNHNIELAWDSSPVGHLQNFTSPVLIIQGDSDRNVDIQESIGLIRALRSKGNMNVESMMFPDENHGFALYSNELIAANATFQFFKKHLQK